MPIKLQDLIDNPKLMDELKLPQHTCENCGVVVNYVNGKIWSGYLNGYVCEDCFYDIQDEFVERHLENLRNAEKKTKGTSEKVIFTNE